MKYRPRIYYTETDKALMYGRLLARTGTKPDWVAYLSCRPIPAPFNMPNPGFNWPPAIQESRLKRRIRSVEPFDVFCRRADQNVLCFPYTQKHRIRNTPSTTWARALGACLTTMSENAWNKSFAPWRSLAPSHFLTNRRANPA